MTATPENVIAEAIDYLAAHWRDQPDLEFLARRAGYESTHFQKLFTGKVGVSPKRLVQYMNMKHARDMLLRGATTLDAAYAVGLSGQGRLHDLCVNIDAATPGEVQRHGRGLTVRYGFHPSPLGEITVAQTPRGVCWLGFQVDQDRHASISRMKTYWSEAAFEEDNSATQISARKILDIWRGASKDRLNLHLHGTNFQIQVWQALLKIPCGMALSYQDIARAIGKPKASRAVGSAVGSNPVSLLIPCHRVIQASGIIENYGWGTPRKKLILGLEAENVAHVV